MDVGQYIKIQKVNRQNWMARAYLDSHFSTNKCKWSKWVMEQIEFPGRANVLELGCGQAELWVGNLRRLPFDCSVFLTDFSKKTLIQASKALGRDASRFGFFVVNAEQIPYEDAVFDIVIANRMLYFTDLKKTLAEIGRILKPGGKLYAATVGKRNMAEIAELYFDYFSAADRTRETVADIFGLDNGYELLSEIFSSVEVKRHCNELLVTESEPLIEYIQSAQGIHKCYLTQSGIRNFKSHLNGIIRRQGSIKITKDEGLFIAEK